MSASLLQEGLTARMGTTFACRPKSKISKRVAGARPCYRARAAAVAEALQRLKEGELRFQRQARDELGETEQTIARVRAVGASHGSGSSCRNQKPDRRHRQEAPLQHYRRRCGSGRGDHGHRAHRRQAGYSGKLSPIDRGYVPSGQPAW